MRLPFYKLYRAFPELDAFGDDACRAYIREAIRTRWLSSIMIGIVVVVTFFTVMVVVGWFMWLLAHVVPASSIFMVVIWIIVPVVTGAVAAYSIRDMWVKHIVLERLQGVRCGGCTYSLLGLAVVDGGVVCPECGERFELAKRGVTQADLMALAAPEQEEHRSE